MILCTGSQGEPLSALTRIAYGDHPNVSVERGDTVIISAKPVPGNELKVHDTINRLAKAGAEVLHQEIAPVHVSGHGNAEEIRTILGLVRPKAVMPVHGEFRMLAAHAQLARDAGVPAGTIVIAENGSVVELDERGPRIVDTVEAGVAFVDGLGVGDVRDVALRDRRHLAEDGVLIVVATIGANGRRGRGARADRARVRRARAARRRDAERGGAGPRRCLEQDITELKLLQEHLHDALGQLVHDRTGRRPMILPVVLEVSGGMSTLRAEPGWADLLVDYAPEGTTAQRLVGAAARVRGLGARVLPAARALGARRGAPSTPGRSARRRCAGPPSGPRRRSSGLERPLDRYLLELETDQAEGRPGTGSPGRRARRVGAGAEPRRSRCGAASGRAGVPRARRARPRAGGPRDRRAVRSAPDPSALWAGLFDLRENLLGGARRPASPRRLGHVPGMAGTWPFGPSKGIAPRRRNAAHGAATHETRAKPRAPSRVRKKRTKTKKARGHQHPELIGLGARRARALPRDRPLGRLGRRVRRRLDRRRASRRSSAGLAFVLPLRSSSSAA